MKSKSVFLAFMVVLAIALPSLGQEDKLGKVEFVNSCSPAVQEKFMRGVAMLLVHRQLKGSRSPRRHPAPSRPGDSLIDVEPARGIGASPKSAAAQAMIDKGRQMGAKPGAGYRALATTELAVPGARQLARAKVRRSRRNTGRRRGADLLRAAPGELVRPPYPAQGQILEAVRQPRIFGIAHYLIRSPDAPRSRTYKPRGLFQIARRAARCISRTSSPASPTDWRRPTAARRHRKRLTTRCTRWTTYFRLPAARARRRSQDLDEARTLTGSTAGVPPPAAAILRRAARARRLARRRLADDSFPFAEVMTQVRALGTAGAAIRRGQKDVKQIAARRAEGGEERVLGERGRGDAARVARLDLARAEKE